MTKTPVNIVYKRRNGVVRTRRTIHRPGALMRGRVIYSRRERPPRIVRYKVRNGVTYTIRNGI